MSQSQEKEVNISTANNFKTIIQIAHISIVSIGIAGTFNMMFKIGQYTLNIFNSFTKECEELPF